MSNWRELESEYMLPVYKRMPVVFERGQGTRLWDDEGKEYLDFFGGHVVVSLGHCHPAVVEAIREQAPKLMHYSNIVYTIPQIKLARLLVENSCFDRAFFCNSGTEAVEAAMKLARKWAKMNRGGAYETISAENAFHGRTLAAITASGTERYKEPFTPLPAGFVHVPFNDVDAIKRATTDKTCAIMLEPIQGEGGVILPDDDYLRQVRAWCDESNLLLILDEVQTGIGRTGKLFAFEHYDVEPDIVTLAKGLGGGFPVGAVLTKEHCAVFVPGDHGTTFGGNPLATSVAHAVVKYMLDNDLFGRVEKMASIMRQKLAGLHDRHPVIEGVRGRGMFWAIEFSEEIAEQVTLACLDEGLVVNNVRPNVLRLTPPLTVSEEELSEGLARLDRVLGRLN